MFSLFRKKANDFFSAVEKRCRFVDAIDRAAEVFYSLKMDQTVYKNATLVYVAFKDRQMAVFGDEGIYVKTGKDFWNEAVKKMLRNFNKENYAQGIVEVVEQIG